MLEVISTIKGLMLWQLSEKPKGKIRRRHESLTHLELFKHLTKT
jgi:hypothetical protein